MPRQCETCCTLSSYRLSLGTDFSLPLFDVIIRLLTFVSAVFWLRVLSRARNTTLDLYYSVLLAALLDFFSLLVLRLLPFSDHGTGALVYGLLNIAALALQWWIQTVVLFFIAASSDAAPGSAHANEATALLQSASPKSLNDLVASPPATTSGAATGGCILDAAATKAKTRATIVSAILAAIAIVALAVDHPHAGTVPTEAALTLGAFTAWVSQFAAPGSFLARHLPLRKPAYPWALFLAISHLFFGVTYALQSASGGVALESGYCLNIISLLYYYLLFAPLLFRTMVVDSTALRDALLLAPLPSQASASPEDPRESEADLRAQALVSLAAGLRRIDASALQLAELLGRGQYAQVYRAVWRGVSVAFKRLNDVNAAQQREQVEALLQEAILLDQLVHPNVVQLLGIVVTPGSLGMVTEFLELGSLFDVITRMRRRDEFSFGEPRTAGILADVARGMLFLHTSDPPIIHRDLKSQNVLLSAGFRAKVADFGVSRVKVATQHMTTTGTPQWMSPEVICGEPYSEKADSPTLHIRT
ncbi:TKL protein kinase [Thecamonas trahens ATCC 50062]|uniref:TKL protein kinase n=1 Tax=Thecamonas trahens ATCC 50062 TaxID=461836 RepID=A0A0L0DPF4_THETB|nr:TKL protein kinase [Thecamonas trahens ATCC 50062]KNC53906.1 TKL protein kinase [Thecamonas trahens ATCC 50062]|eukprot:XP_013754112.1 TKL protein kinase [Thecamonas trahens ATCC 50062]